MKIFAPHTIDDIRSANRAAGYHFFDEGAMRFFHSKVYKRVLSGYGGVYFVTSERPDISAAVKFTVRRFDPQTSNVHTATEFYGIDTLNEAYRQMQALADGIQQSAE